MTNEIEKILNEIYIKFENEKPPITLSRAEADWNDGFYMGKLKAIEDIVRYLTGKNGDEIQKRVKI
jgi:hypothetical protein